MLDRRLLSAIVATCALLGAARVAADCQPAGTPAEVLPNAEIAFVGEVVDVGEATARIAVTEVWAGDVGAVVEVRGLGDEGRGPELGVAEGPSEDDRRWVLGTTYLILPFTDGNILRDHICTATTEWTDELAALRPADARVLADPAVNADPPVMLLGIALVGVGAIGVSWFAFRRRSA